MAFPPSQNQKNDRTRKRTQGVEHLACLYVDTARGVGHGYIFALPSWHGTLFERFPISCPAFGDFVHDQFRA